MLVSCLWTARCSLVEIVLHSKLSVNYKLSDRSKSWRESHPEPVESAKMHPLPFVLLPVQKWLHHKTHLVKLWYLQMMVIGLIKEGHEFANRCNVEQPLWCTVPVENVQLASEFQSAIIQSVLYTSITVWFGPATKWGKNRLKRTVRAWYCLLIK